MVIFWAPGCSHYNQKETCRFFRLPKSNPERRKRITLIIRRDVVPGPGAFVCSCYFKDGKRENGPTIFVHNMKKRFNLVYGSPERKKRKTNKVPRTITPAAFTDKINVQDTIPNPLRDRSV